MKQHGLNDSDPAAVLPSVTSASFVVKQAVRTSDG